MDNANVVLWGWTKGDCRAAVTLAQTLYPFSVVSWFADAPDVSNTFREYLYTQPNFGKVTATPAEWALSEAEILQFLERFSREKRSQGLDCHEQMHVAKSYFAWFLNLLRTKNVNHVLFELIPLTGLDFVLYLAAKRLDIATTCCFPSLFPNRFFVCHTIEDFGCFSELSGGNKGDLPEFIWGFEQDLFYMRDTKFRSRYGKPWPRFIREMWRHGFRQSSKPQRLSGVVESLLKGLDFQNHYKDFATASSSLDLDVPFVYFPLHLQPELTTAALGGVFNDQLDALERLANIIPENWLIYAKENPKQGCEQRGPEFFHRIKAMAKVRYLAKETNTVSLLKHCRFVATVTGTAGWEAILGGKPCLVFGLAWYASMPGVIRYSATTSIDEILSHQPTRADKIKHLELIYEKTREGIFDLDYAKIYSAYDRETNTQTLAKFIGETVCGATLD
jgi:hypothetical protein